MKWLIVICLHIFSVCASDVVMVSLAAGHRYRQIVAAGIENKKAYCKKQGYDLVICENFLDRSRPPPWSKIPLLLQVMEDRSHEWIFWTDADAIVMNFDVRLEQFIDENYNFILTRDLFSLNTGHFFIRNCEWSREFLKKVYEHKEFIFNSPWEQAAVIVEIENHPEWMEKTKIIPQRFINSYPIEVYRMHGFVDPDGLYQDGDFIMHFAGIRANHKLAALFQKYVTGID